MNAQPAAQPAAGPPPRRGPARASPPHRSHRLHGRRQTTVGRLLAARLNWDFLDLDAYIESRAGLSVPSIFSAHGEAHFRQLESAALASALGRNRLVLALGGGAPEVLTNRLLLEQTPATATIFLDAPFPTLFDRCMMQALNPTPASAEPARARPSRARQLRAAPPAAGRPRRRRSPLPHPPAHLPPPRPPHPRHRQPHPRRDRRRPPRPPHLTRINIGFERKVVNHSEAVILSEASRSFIARS